MVMLDEANILLDMHRNIFRSASHPEKLSLARPLFSPLISELSSHSDIHLVTAGTRLELNDKELWASSVLKFGAAAGIIPEVFSDFPLMTMNDISFVERLVRKEYVKYVFDYFFRLMGGSVRFRAFTSLCSYMAAKDKNSDNFISHIPPPPQYRGDPQDPLEHFNLVFYSFLMEFLAGDHREWTLRYMINRFVNRLGKTEAHNYLCQLVICFFSTQRLKIQDDKACWMSEGFCRLSPKDFQYTIEESIVVQAVIYYFNKEVPEKSLSIYFAQTMLTAHDAASAGTMLETLQKTEWKMG